MSEPKLKGWHHMPEVPLKVSPFFSWPLEPLAMLQWLWNSWLLISEKLIILAIAFASCYWLQPPVEAMQSWEWSWMLALYARNFLLALAIGGALHLWFYTFSAQGLQLKYDPRPLVAEGKQFTLGGQIRDNMFWTLGTGVLIWTAYEAILLWALANGHMPLLTWASSPFWFVALFLLIPIWESFYFYLIHRAIHIPWLYKRVHYLHHRNVNVGPWSGMSQHPIEQMIFLASVFVHLLVGAHPVHILFHLQYYFLTAMTTHTGFQGLVIRNKNRLALGTFHHQMHHRYFECNYGSLEIPWDKWFGTFHDGTVVADAKMRERRRKLMRKRGA